MADLTQGPGRRQNDNADPATCDGTHAPQVDGTDLEEQPSAHHADQDAREQASDQSRGNRQSDVAEYQALNVSRGCPNRESKRELARSTADGEHHPSSVQVA